MFSLFRLRTHARSFPFAFFIDTQSRKQRSRKVARVRFSVFSRLLRMLGRDVRHSFVFYYGEEKTKKQVRKKKVDRASGREGGEREQQQQQQEGLRHTAQNSRESRERQKKQRKISKIKNYKQSIAPPHTLTSFSLSLSLSHTHTPITITLINRSARWEVKANTMEKTRISP